MCACVGASEVAAETGPIEAGAAGEAGAVEDVGNANAWTAAVVSTDFFLKIVPSSLSRFFTFPL